MEECCGSDAPRLPCVLSKAGGPHASTPHDTPPCTCTGPSIPEHGLTLHYHAKCAHALQRFAQHLPLRLRRARGGWASGPLPAAGRRAHIRSAACTGARPVNSQHLESEAGSATSKAPTAAARWHGPAAAAPAQTSCEPVHAPHMQRPGQQGQGPWTCKALSARRQRGQRAPAVAGALAAASLPGLRAAAARGMPSVSALGWAGRTDRRRPPRQPGPAWNRARTACLARPVVCTAGHREEAAGAGGKRTRRGMPGCTDAWAG